MDFLKNNSGLLELVKDETKKYNEYEARVIRTWLQRVVGYDVMTFAEKIHHILKLNGPMGPTKDETIPVADLEKIGELLNKLLTIGEMFANINDGSEYNPVKWIIAEQAIECPKCGEVALDLRNRWGEENYGPKNDINYRLYACHGCEWFWERETAGAPLKEFTIEKTLEEIERDQDIEYRIPKDEKDPLVLDEKAELRKL